MLDDGVPPFLRLASCREPDGRIPPRLPSSPSTFESLRPWGSGPRRSAVSFGPCCSLAALGGSGVSFPALLVT